jgi:hypothetical protein
MVLQDTVYISKVIVNKPYDLVWSQLSNPTNYARLYPNWVKMIKNTGENQYLVDDQFGNSYPIETELNKDFGVIDLKIGPEASKTRLISLDSNSTAVIHLAKKWNDINFIGWYFHKRTTDKDLNNVKKLLEEK